MNARLAPPPQAGRLRELRVDVDPDGERTPRRLAFDRELDRDGLRRAASIFALEHGLVDHVGACVTNGGQPKCGAVDTIVDAMAELAAGPADHRNERRCDFATEGVLCCG